MTASPGIVDVHAHYFAPDYFAILDRIGLGSAFSLPVEDDDRRFAAMTEAGVGRQILSATHAPYAEAEADAVEAARYINDHHAALARTYSDRLSFFASLPLPHAQAAVTETARAFDELDALGVTIQCFCRGESIARPAFDPVWAELDRRGATVFLHPCQNGLCSPLVNDWGLTVCAGASMEDAVAAMHLIRAAIPHRFPKVRIIVPHFGGILPMLLERLDGQMPQDGLAERPSATARRFWYDTVGWGSKAALLAAVTAFGADRLVPGSDWPILLRWESYARTFRHIREARLPPADVEAILRRNVWSALGRSPF